MQCPRCQSPFHEVPVAGVQVDVCPTCRGFWFDAGELDAFRRAHAGEARDAAPPFVATGSIAPDTCPRCARTELRAGEAGAHSFQVCSHCGGAFVSHETSRAIGGRTTVRSATQAAAPDSPDLPWLVSDLVAPVLEFLLESIVS
ncbi:MAG: zf-TFIIB domain-containing protein [Myxococcota bacterium]|nr:zf-TFIIB domain-containing protein [Myxococcota bacterium]